MRLKRRRTRAITCETCDAGPNDNAMSFEDWLTPELETLSWDMGQHMPYYDRAGLVISFAESMWLSHVDPHYALVRHTHYPTGGMVSTAHLFFNHCWEPGHSPLIFETMVFQVDGWEDYQARYTTEAEALVGHEATVARIKAGENPE